MSTILAAKNVDAANGAAVAVYNLIFFTNILRLLDEQGLSRQELSERAGISISFLSDLTNGKANPSLRIMEAIANALGTPLPALLESTDMDSASLDAAVGTHVPSSLPAGYVRVNAVLPEHQAFVVRKWANAVRQKLNEPSS